MGAARAHTVWIGLEYFVDEDDALMMAVDNIIAGKDDDSAMWDVNLEMVYHEEEK